MIMSLLIFLMISSAVSISRDKSILFSSVVIMNLVFATIMTMNNLYVSPLEKGMGMYGGLFNVDVLSQSFNVFMFLMSAIMLMLTGFYPSKVYIKEFSSVYSLFLSKFWYNKNLISNKAGEQFRIMEYSLIMVFMMSGAVFLVSTGDLISIFLSIELQSYGLYMLSTMYSDSESSTASGLTYFLLGGLSSCFILLGSALLYANSGTTNLDNIYMMYSMTENLTWYDPLFIDLSLMMLLVGFLFKMSAAPFHFWSPDVYDGVPTMVTTYMAIMAKMSMFGLFMDLFSHMNNYSDSWTILFFLSSFLSFMMGSVLGLTQFSMKSLFAYSTMSHVGFMLLGLCTDSVESVQASIFYMLQYTVSNLNGFLILLSIGYLFYLYTYEEEKKNSRFAIKSQLSDENNSPIQLISQMKGYFYMNSFMSMSLAMTLFSFMGVPPMMGFFAKQMMLSAALDKGMMFMSLVAMLTSVMGAAYYLNLIKQMFFFKDDYKKNSSMNNKELVGYMTSQNIIDNTNMNYSESEAIKFKPENMTLNSALSGSMSVMTMLLSLFMYMPEEWFNIVGVLALTLYKY